ncbi:MAG: SRPBCC family protein [Flavobacteriales bacterium]|nr:SRPBCC family protein [Flavobacteriales bacterium]
MKALKIIGIILVLIIGGIMLLPSDVRVERSITINANTDIVFNQVNNLKNWEIWSPWGKKDRTIYGKGYSGPDAGVGCKHCWDSEVEEVGKGCLTIVESLENVSMQTKLEFDGMNPGQGTWVFNEVENGIEVIWGMNMDMGMSPIGKFFGLLMDGMIGPDFETGLSSLKDLCENMPVPEEMPTADYEIQEIEIENQTYVAIRAEVAMEDIAAYYGENLPIIYQKVAESGAEPTIASGIYWKWDEETGMADMAAAVLANGEEISEIEGCENVIVSGKALMIAYYGAYEKVGPAHEAMDAYMEKEGLESNELVIENYITDPATEPDTSKWLTNIYYLVK